MIQRSFNIGSTIVQDWFKNGSNLIDMLCKYWAIKRASKWVQKWLNTPATAQTGSTMVQHWFDIDWAFAGKAAKMLQNTMKKLPTVGSTLVQYWRNAGPTLVQRWPRFFLTRGRCEARLSQTGPRGR